ncbi:MAG: Rpn family recombination-promoting nuclease/putative transposase [Oscillospiraceae bacterium]|nr:Rpn family recombination-promoting nuclease/putative transposase [Oscillospiraceae bacterium]
MPRNAVILKLDVIFKKAFTEHDEMLRGLLCGLLQVEAVENIKIRNSEIVPDGIDGKFVRMDLNLEADGKLINVEMQYRVDSDFKDRALFHWSKLYGGELKSGEDYRKLKPSICINIVNFNLFDCSDYHSCFKVMEEERHEVLSDKCEIHFFELKKIGKSINKDDKVRLWLQLINAETEEELDMLEQTGVLPIQNAVRVVRDMSEDTRIREAARIREKAMHDEASAMNSARREGVEQGIRQGIQQGLQQGVRQGRQQMLDKLRELGISEEIIGKIEGQT